MHTGLKRHLGDRVAGAPKFLLKWMHHSFICSLEASATLVVLADDMVFTFKRVSRGAPDFLLSRFALLQFYNLVDVILI